MDFRVANLIWLNALSLVFFFLVFYSKHQHHKAYGYLAVFMFTAYNFIFFLSVRKDNVTYGYTYGAMYVYLAILYSALCLVIFLYRKFS